MRLSDTSANCSFKVCLYLTSSKNVIAPLGDLSLLGDVISGEPKGCQKNAVLLDSIFLFEAKNPQPL